LSSAGSSSALHHGPRLRATTRSVPIDLVSHRPTALPATWVPAICSAGRQRRELSRASRALTSSTYTGIPPPSQQFSARSLSPRRVDQPPLQPSGSVAPTLPGSTHSGGVRSKPTRRCRGPAAPRPSGRAIRPTSRRADQVLPPGLSSGASVAPTVAVIRANSRRTTTSGRSSFR